MSERKSIADIVKKINDEIVISHNTPENFLICCANKNNSESVWLREPVTGKKKKLVMNFTVNEKANVFTFAIKNNITEKIEIPAEANTKTLKSDKINTHIIFTVWNENMIKFINDIIIYCVENFEPSDKFGCCGKYLECSKSEKCLHDNKFYAKACWYRKNLESGKIFY